MLTIFFVFLLIYTLIASKKIYGSYISPLSIFLGNFFLALSLFYSIDFIYQDLSRKAVILIGISLIAFLFGVIMAHLVRKTSYPSVKNAQNIYSQRAIEISKDDIKIFRILFFLSLVGYFYFIFMIERQLGLINVLLNPNLLNLAFGFDDISLNSIPLYLMKLSMVNSMFLLIYTLKFQYKKKETIAMFIISILINISVKRNILLYIIIMNIFIFIYYNRGNILAKFKKHQIKTRLMNWRHYFLISSIGVVFLYFFIQMQSLLNKQSEIQGSLLGIDLPSNIVSVIRYYVANIASFDVYLSMDFSNVPIFGSTLRFFYKVLDQLNVLEYNDEFLIMEFVSIPDSFNTTIGQFYIYTESGIIGLLLFYSFIGFTSTILYLKYLRKKDDILLLFLALISLLLLFSIREYVLIFVDFWISFIVIFILYIYIRAKKQYRKREV